MGEKLTPAQKRFLVELLNPAHRGVEAAAKACSVPPRTAWGWMRRADFRAELDARQGEQLDEAARRLVSRLELSENVFLQVMGDKTQPAGVRVRAASELANLALRLFEARNITARLLALEAQLAGGAGADNTPTIVMDF